MTRVKATRIARGECPADRPKLIRAISLLVTLADDADDMGLFFSADYYRGLEQQARQLKEKCA